MNTKILVCCGNGIGSSMLMKTRVNSVLNKHDVKFEIDHSSLGDAKTLGNNYDIILCPNVFKKDLNNLSKKVIIIGLKNILDENEIEDKLMKENILN